MVRDAVCVCVSRLWTSFWKAFEGYLASSGSLPNISRWWQQRRFCVYYPGKSPSRCQKMNSQYERKLCNNLFRHCRSFSGNLKASRVCWFKRRKWLKINLNQKLLQKNRNGYNTNERQVNTITHGEGEIHKCFTLRTPKWLLDDEIFVKEVNNYFIDIHATN